MRLLPIAIASAALVAAAGCTTSQKSSTGPREYAIAVTDRGFEPARTVIPRGQAVTLVLTRKSDRTCATEILFPRLNQRHELPLDQPVRIEIAAGAVTDTLGYACGMNMLSGTIVAE
ncbi:MAG TPA: cupredoxin domain-containing protein [Candidatus Eisenbacteria bacterium]|jgi:plastocyanin domain-containing protein